ncbi:hypothetical protein RCL1_003563 [Eukaryota sp. TZLM3-RCL]
MDLLNDHEFLIDFANEEEPFINQMQDFSLNLNLTKTSPSQSVGYKKHHQDLLFKLKVANFAEANTAYKASQHFRVPYSNAKRWSQQVIQLRDATNSKCTAQKGRKRLSGGGRKLAEPLLETELFERYLHARLKHQPVHVKDLVEWGKEIVGTESILQFSNGWVTGFLRRHNLVLRQTNQQVIVAPAVLVQRVKDFYQYFWNTLGNGRFHSRNIINLDETAVFIDGGNTTLEQKGTKKVSVIKSGFEKVRITALLAARADGSKMKPTVIIKRSSGPGFEERSNCYVLYSTKSWITGALFKLWLEHVFSVEELRYSLFVFDAAPGHRSQLAKNFLEESGATFAIIPGGATSVLQPADVSWFKPFKTSLRERVRDWLSLEHIRSRAGRISMIPDTMTIEWVVDCWAVIKNDLIVKSFDVTLFNSINELFIASHSVYSSMFLQVMKHNNEPNFTLLDDCESEELFCL